MDVDEDGEINDLYVTLACPSFLSPIMDAFRQQKSSTEFYTNFWSLQDFFSKPFQLWERTSWNTFVHVNVLPSYLACCSSSMVDIPLEYQPNTGCLRQQSIGQRQDGLVVWRFVLC